MIRFASPWAFALALPLAAAAWRMLRRARAAALTLPGAGALVRRATWRHRARHLPPALVLAGAACGIVALARPQETLSTVRSTRDAIAIEMALDVSGSMRELDYSKSRTEPKTRLAVVKETFAEFVEKRPDDLIGLVAFGGYASTRAPLTFDHRALLDVLAETRIPGEDGGPVGNDELQTAIGDGLAMAVARLGAASNVASRIVVLLSDGVNNFGSIAPGQAAALARHEGVKVYAIGVGTPESAAQAGGLFGLLGARGDGVDSRALKAIAKATGGRYFDVRSKTGLEKSLAEIDALERTEVESRTLVRRGERAAPWLAACCALFFCALPLGAALRRSPA